MRFKSYKKRVEKKPTKSNMKKSLQKKLVTSKRRIGITRRTRVYGGKRVLKGRLIKKNRRSKRRNKRGAGLFQDAWEWISGAGHLRDWLPKNWLTCERSSDNSRICSLPPLVRHGSDGRPSYLSYEQAIQQLADINEYESQVQGTLYNISRVEGIISSQLPTWTYLDKELGNILNSQISIDCSNSNDGGIKLYRDLLYVISHHIIQIIVVGGPTYKYAEQFLVYTNSLLIIMYKKFTGSIAETDTIKESFVLTLGWAMTVFNKAYDLLSEISTGVEMLTNLTGAIIEFIGTTSVNLANTAGGPIMPLALFVYLLFNLFIRTYMYFMSKQEASRRILFESLSSLKMRIGQFEQFNFNEQSNIIVQDLWEMILSSVESQFGIILPSDWINAEEMVQNLCRRLLDYDSVSIIIKSMFSDQKRDFSEQEEVYSTSSRNNTRSAYDRDYIYNGPTSTAYGSDYGPPPPAPSRNRGKMGDRSNAPSRLFSDNS